MKKIICILLSLILTLVCMPTAMSAQNAIVIDSVGFNGSICEIIGHIDGGSAGSNVTLLARTAEAFEKNADVTIENTVYIDQTETGNNGTFIFDFKINGRFSEKDIVFLFGSDADTDSLHYEYFLPVLTGDFESVANNSVLYGHDIYHISSTYMTSKYVVQSILNGGNIIYFKLGDKWYDLLNEKATSSAYLIAENAAKDEAVKAYATGMYYQGSTRMMLKGA